MSSLRATAKFSNGCPDRFAKGRTFTKPITSRASFWLTKPARVPLKATAQRYETPPGAGGLQSMVRVRQPKVSSTVAETPAEFVMTNEPGATLLPP